MEQEIRAVRERLAASEAQPLAMVQSFGCQLNMTDGEKLKWLLLSMGYGLTEEPEQADLILLNTCAVREHAEDRVFGHLGQLKPYKQKKPGLIIGLCGCMTAEETVREKLKASYPYVNLVVGTGALERLPAMLLEILEGKKHSVDPTVQSAPSEELSQVRSCAFKASVPIMYGCNNFCTYCIVPYTRGREKSRRPEDIIAEVKALAADGVKEVTLLGQNVNSYRGVSADSGNEWDFADLIYALNEVEGLERIRFMTSHPKDLSDKLIAAFAECDKLCNYIHLPVQAGSSSVLRRMNRKYTREQYLELVRKLREAVPGIAISTDIIVGFPGETEEDFCETLSLAEEIQYDSAFTFLYSPRRGTPAADYENQIPEDVKHERFNRLVEVMNRGSKARNAAFVGRVCRVLVDGPDKKSSGILNGRTEEFKLVDFEGPEELIGSMVDVEITASNTFSLQGRIVSEQE